MHLDDVVAPIHEDGCLGVHTGSNTRSVDRPTETLSFTRTYFPVASTIRECEKPFFTTRGLGIFLFLLARAD